MLIFPSSALATVKGERDMDSIPPTITIFDSLARIAFAANIMAFILEPHILLIVSAGISAGIPALRAACRAGCCPIPACKTLPIITSSTISASTPVCSNVPLIAIAPRSTAGVLNNTPLNLPCAVRTPPTITTSRGYSMEKSQHSGLVKELRRSLKKSQTRPADNNNHV